MSFVMIATGGASGSRVRTLSSRGLLLGVGLGAALLLAAGAALGWWAAQRALPVPAGAVAAAAPVRAPLMPMALEQIGALSARLFRLESEAAVLSRRLNLAPSRAAAASAAAGTASAAEGQGGPMLPPRAADGLLQDAGAWAQRLAELEQRLLAVSDASALQNLKLLRLPTRLPVLGAAVVSGYGNRSDPFNHRHAFHAGLDFAAGSGTPILAAGGGSVSFAGHRPDFGWTVEIDHGDGLVTRYAHASRLLVKTGALVTPGTTIAQVGSTGRSTGPHLHFEVLRRGETVDPRRYLVRE
jgi:murein DD-endopeptidase MepM/ murein hydrolase activator NlpD